MAFPGRFAFSCGGITDFCGKYGGTGENTAPLELFRNFDGARFWSFQCWRAAHPCWRRASFTICSFSAGGHALAMPRGNGRNTIGSRGPKCGISPCSGICAGTTSFSPCSVGGAHTGPRSASRSGRLPAVLRWVTRFICRNGNSAFTSVCNAEERYGPLRFLSFCRWTV